MPASLAWPLLGLACLHREERKGEQSRAGGVRSGWIRLCRACTSGAREKESLRPSGSSGLGFGSGLIGPGGGSLERSRKQRRWLGLRRRRRPTCSSRTGQGPFWPRIASRCKSPCRSLQRLLTLLLPEDSETSKAAANPDRVLSKSTIRVTHIKIAYNYMTKKEK